MSLERDVFQTKELMTSQFEGVNDLLSITGKGSTK